jgi:hypothetical protein
LPEEQIENNKKYKHRKGHLCSDISFRKRNPQKTEKQGSRCISGSYLFLG